MTRVPDTKPKTAADRRQDAAREAMGRDGKKRSLVDWVFSSRRAQLILWWSFIALIAVVVLLRLNLMVNLAERMN